MQRPTPDPLPDLLTPAEVAEALRVSPRTLVRWGQAGKLNFIRTPLGQRRYKRADVERILTTGGGAS